MSENKAPRTGAQVFGMEVTPSREALDEAIEMNGRCRPDKCWHFVAINEIMERWSPGERHHVRIDAGTVRLNYHGWRYVACTPKHVKHSLMRFDRGEYPLVTARRYKLRFQRTTRIQKISDERKAQVDASRKTRIEENRNHYKGPATSLRKRVEGFSGIV